jgi:hypothetical protein
MPSKNLCQIKMNQMNNMNEYNKIKAEVLSEIKTGKINMRPRFYFGLKLVALILVAFVVLLISSFLVSFIIFSIIESGRMFVLGFGFRGVCIFFVLFPWLLLLIEILLIVLLEWLIKQFKFGYLMSLTTLSLIILCLSIAISIIIGSTPIHPALLRRAEQKSLPVFGNFYRGIHRPPPQNGFIRGTISAIGTSSFTMIQTMDADCGSTTAQITSVILPTPQAIAGLLVGDTVLVVGQQFQDHLIRAFGIQKLSSLASSSPDAE